MKAPISFPVTLVRDGEHVSADFTFMPGKSRGKMGVAQWVPMSAPVRAAVLAALERNAAIGEAPLFPAPRRPGASWTRHHAKDLLERAEIAARKAALKREDAEAAAALAPLDGSDFHAYRRAWARHESISRSRMWPRRAGGERRTHLSGATHRWTRRRCWRW